MYKVRNLQDDVYQVVFVNEEDDYNKYAIRVTVEFQGNLSDCEAYIRLEENNNF